MNQLLIVQEEEEEAIRRKNSKKRLGGLLRYILFRLLYLSYLSIDFKFIQSHESLEKGFTTSPVFQSAPFNI